MGKNILTIGVDIDGTIARTDQKLDSIFTRKSPGSYDYEGLTEQYFKEHPDFYSDLELVPGSQEVLQKLAQSHRIIYITQRHESAYDETIRWLETNGYPHGPVYMTDDKGKTGKELGLDVAFDDQTSCAESYKDVGITCFLLAKPYNLSDRFVRIEWKDIAV